MYYEVNLQETQIFTFFTLKYKQGAGNVMMTLWIHVNRSNIQIQE